MGSFAVYILIGGVMGTVLFPKLYDDAWLKVRVNRHHKPLQDELLWHKAYEQYIHSLPYAEGLMRVFRGAVIERHLRILRPVAWNVALKRCPRSLGIWSKEGIGPPGKPGASLVHLTYELAAFGVLGLIVAENRFQLSQGWAFSTYADHYVKKFIRLYLDELVGIVPRTGHMGIAARGKNAEGEEWVVYKPRRSVMDLVDAALAGTRPHRGKAAGGNSQFDSGTPDDDTSPVDPHLTLGYLQREVSFRHYPWEDWGCGWRQFGVESRFEIKGGVSLDVQPEARDRAYPGGHYYKDPLPKFLDEWFRFLFEGQTYFGERHATVVDVEEHSSIPPQSPYRQSLWSTFGRHRVSAMARRLIEYACAPADYRRDNKWRDVPERRCLDPYCVWDKHGNRIDTPILLRQGHWVVNADGVVPKDGDGSWHTTRHWRTTHPIGYDHARRPRFTSRAHDYFQLLYGKFGVPRKADKPPTRKAPKRSRHTRFNIYAECLYRARKRREKTNER
jgi:hypothetical protein